jgi:hypothetical protein
VRVCVPLMLSRCDGVRLVSWESWGGFVFGGVEPGRRDGQDGQDRLRVVVAKRRLGSFTTVVACLLGSSFLISCRARRLWGRGPDSRLRERAPSKRNTQMNRLSWAWTHSPFVSTTLPNSLLAIDLSSNIYLSHASSLCLPPPPCDITYASNKGTEFSRPETVSSIIPYKIILI